MNKTGIIYGVNGPVIYLKGHQSVPAHARASYPAAARRRHQLRVQPLCRPLGERHFACAALAGPHDPASDRIRAG